ncbi:hypothetical protein ACQP3J_29980, partial [Escherichia coli]
PASDKARVEGSSGKAQDDNKISSRQSVFYSPYTPAPPNNAKVKQFWQKKFGFSCFHFSSLYSKQLLWSIF